MIPSIAARLRLQCAMCCSFERAGRILIAVDDVQWLDPSSSRALAFALRRLEASHAASARTASRRGRAAVGTRAGAGVGRVRQMVVGPLSVGALHRFLRDRLGTSFARQTLLRIHERSGGNPFFALEVARILAVDIDPLQPLPVPETVEELVSARISALPASLARRSLCRGDGHDVDSLLERAGVAAEALDAAVAACVIERENGTIRFTHPLLSSVLYADLGEERRDVHARIAEVVDDPVLRARHIALSTGTPDADVARLLDDVAVLRPIAAPRRSRPSSPSKRSG